jgi:hypothetical protein
MGVKVEGGRTIIPFKVGFDNAEPHRLENTVQSILSSIDFPFDDRRIKKILNRGSNEIDVYLEDYEIGENAKISPQINMLAMERDLSLRLFFDGPIRHVILYDLLKMQSTLDGRYELKNAPVGCQEMTEVIPATQGKYFIDSAKRLYQITYDNVELIRKMIPLRITNHEMLDETAKEKYSKMMLGLLGVDFSSQ